MSAHFLFFSFYSLACISPGTFSNTRPSPGQPDISLFMAVPTIYSHLLKEYASRPEAEQRLFKRALRGLRLMVSGSAALPRTIFDE
jgi:malonyl-CoA/methylmalonyl-CoA synthetase